MSGNTKQDASGNVDIDAILCDSLDEMEDSTFESQGSHFCDVSDCQEMASDLLTKTGVREACDSNDTYQIVRQLTMVCGALFYLSGRVASVACDLRVIRRIICEKEKAEQNG